MNRQGASSVGNWSSSGPSGPAASRGQRFPPPIPSSNQNSGNDVQMLMDQVRQLQQKVTELSNTSGGASSHAGPFEAEQPLNQSILLVSNLPPSLATCDALFFMFDRFGTVERVKILHNKRSAALVQMQTSEMAEHAVNEQHLLNRIGADIYVNYSNKVTEIRTPAEKGMPDDGLTKDFTYPLAPPPRQQGAFFSGSSYGEIAANRGLPPPPVNNGCCILASSLPDELANTTSISNLFGHYGDVYKVKILHNKPDCALVQMSKPHQAALCKQFLDQVKVNGKTICVSFSRIQELRQPTSDNEEEFPITNFIDLTNSRYVHRFRNHAIAVKLTKSLSSPSHMLHVANVPENFTTDQMRQYIVDNGYTVADIMDCSKGENHMNLIQMGSPEEAIKALAKLHNVNPEGYQTRNNAGLCFSFSGRKSTKSSNDD